MKSINLNDLSFLSKKYQKIYINSFKKVLKVGSFVLGNEVRSFEKNFSTFTNSKYCVTCANGTDALYLSLKSLNIKKNQKILLSANAGFYATSQLLNLGLDFDFVDIVDDYYGPSLEKIIDAYDESVAAIIVTHLYGYANEDILEIKKFCNKKNIFLIEDCAQAVGVKINGKHVGSYGDIATYSFYPTKNLGALGDAGAITCQSKKIYQNLISLRQYGWKKKYFVNFNNGINSRMDEIQASILNKKLKSIYRINYEKIKIVKFYIKNIKNKKIFVNKRVNNYNGHLFVIQTNERNKLINYLKKNKIFAQIHYPILDYKQKIISKKFKHLSLKNTEHLSTRILSLPIYYGMTQKELILITRILNLWK